MHRFHQAEMITFYIHVNIISKKEKEKGSREYRFNELPLKSDKVILKLRKE